MTKSELGTAARSAKRQVLVFLLNDSSVEASSMHDSSHRSDQVTISGPHGRVSHHASNPRNTVRMSSRHNVSSRHRPIGWNDSSQKRKIYCMPTCSRESEPSVYQEWYDFLKSCVLIPVEPVVWLLVPSGVHFL